MILQREFKEVYFQLISKVKETKNLKSLIVLHVIRDIDLTQLAHLILEHYLNQKITLK